mmetsp:Transcript_27758/g.77810  ORF Transcript_27758/g.77810 Transcript_27758/m.77810 type:complete len:261 (+) Transcript_27758:231-1013(+)
MRSPRQRKIAEGTRAQPPARRTRHCTATAAAARPADTTMPPNTRTVPDGCCWTWPSEGVDPRLSPRMSAVPQAAPSTSTRAAGTSATGGGDASAPTGEDATSAVANASQGGATSNAPSMWRSGFGDVMRASSASLASVSMRASASRRSPSASSLASASTSDRNSWRPALINSCTSVSAAVSDSRCMRSTRSTTSERNLSNCPVMSSARMARCASASAASRRPATSGAPEFGDAPPSDAVGDTGAVSPAAPLTAPGKEAVL